MKPPDDSPDSDRRGVEDVEVVIPTVSDDVLTTDSIPDTIPVHIERQGTLNEARNRGVRNAESDVVAVMDDDLLFKPELLSEWAAQVDAGTLVGMADWDFGWIAGRVMVFQTSLWEDVGGFDERLKSHMGDTKFALDALNSGYEIERIPREVVYHEPHDRSISTLDRAWRSAYLAINHPRKTPNLIGGLLG